MRRQESFLLLQAHFVDQRNDIFRRRLMLFGIFRHRFLVARERLDIAVMLTRSREPGLMFRLLYRRLFRFVLIELRVDIVRAPGDIQFPVIERARLDVHFRGIARRYFRRDPCGRALPFYLLVTLHFKVQLMMQRFFVTVQMLDFRAADRNAHALAGVRFGYARLRDFR